MINNAILAGVFYFNAYFLYPVVYNEKKQLLRYVLALIGTIALVLWLSRFIDSQLSLFNQADMVRLHPRRWGGDNRPRGGFRDRGWFGWYFTNMLTYLSITGISISYRIIIDNAQQEKIRKEKENENLKTELSFLRSQVSPHFIFNILNNMASMARKKSDMLEPSIIELSNLMRYMLYESEGSKVLLTREVDYLNSYMALQLLRFGDDVTIVFNIPDNINAYYIEPMILVPFVENAFKHGIGMLTDPVIAIDLQIDGDHWLNFTVTNKVAPVNDSKDKSSGIGLANVKRRLDLLYGNNHDLQITNDGTTFTCTLKIKLN
jgi:LytS/YehU family sensor histidine kinase